MPRERQILSTALTDDPNSNWFCLFAFIYGSAVMTIVIVALIKSARKRRADTQKTG